ncbi:hypothetical protein LPB140_08000 [Sphingorhabdus lutea]|uniref:DUF883 family protein n=1 Tax=Sphingorhabdus lutea TaxID=1913578 RepID=A0A1L3JCA9_9SPHN|nr:hypothetical protein [Sphingorhabdus lutea]APG62739.1 hypothetical protein LPB140_08000 [Sphingorhabdus lutea]
MANKTSNDIKTARDKISAGKSNIANATSNIGQKAADIRQKAVDYSKNSSEKSKKIAQKAKNSSVNFVENNPLGAVASGLVFGALLAALIPTSEKEKMAVKKGTANLKDKAYKAVDAAKTALAENSQDLNQSAKNSYGDLLEKAANLVKNAGKAAKDAANISDKDK